MSGGVRRQIGMPVRAQVAEVMGVGFAAIQVQGVGQVMAIGRPLRVELAPSPPVRC